MAQKEKKPLSYWLMLALLLLFSMYELSGVYIGFQRREFYNTLSLTLPFYVLLATNILWSMIFSVVTSCFLLLKKWVRKGLFPVFSIYALAEYIPLLLFSDKFFTITEFITRGVSWVLFLAFVYFLSRTNKIKALFNEL